MSMQALNQLVARSIVDPTVVQAFRSGRIGDVLDELGHASTDRWHRVRFLGGVRGDFVPLREGCRNAGASHRAPVARGRPLPGRAVAG